jgi:CheY-like chemotaxis protein
LALPLDCRVAPAAIAPAEPGESHDGERVLLSVDDDPSVAPLLEKMLAGHGYRVVASSPSSAVSDARRLRPAAILLDIIMPGRDGREILRELKSDPDTRPIPVIVLTVVDAADKPDLADGHIGKPIVKDRLLHLLQEHAATPSVQP